MTYSFEKLDTWQYARQLVHMVYDLTARFPTEEKYSLTSQIRRASVSVSSNIAEGSTRWSRKEKARYYEMAYGSLMECLNQAILSLDLLFISENEYRRVRDLIETISRMLNSLYNDALGD